jgi:hypothetical protein
LAELFPLLTYEEEVKGENKWLNDSESMAEAEIRDNRPHRRNFGASEKNPKTTSFFPTISTSTHSRPFLEAHMLPQRLILFYAIPWERVQKSPGSGVIAWPEEGRVLM